MDMYSVQLKKHTPQRKETSYKLFEVNYTSVVFKHKQSKTYIFLTNVVIWMYIASILDTNFPLHMNLLSPHAYGKMVLY